jgi:hypothetical protein
LKWKTNFLCKSIPSLPCPSTNHINFVISILCVCALKLMLFLSLDFVAFYDFLSFFCLCISQGKKIRVCKIMYFMQKSISRTKQNSNIMRFGNSFFLMSLKSLFVAHIVREIFPPFSVIVQSLFFLFLSSNFSPFSTSDKNNIMLLYFKRPKSRID